MNKKVELLETGRVQIIVGVDAIVTDDLDLAYRFAYKYLGSNDAITIGLMSLNEDSAVCKNLNDRLNEVSEERRKAYDAYDAEFKRVQKLTEELNNDKE